LTVIRQGLLLESLLVKQVVNAELKGLFKPVTLKTLTTPAILSTGLKAIHRLLQLSTMTPNKKITILGVASSMHND
jgi:hypothetical protein